MSCYPLYTKSIIRYFNRNANLYPQYHQTEMPKVTQRILIVGPTRVGDSVIAQSLYRRIKQLNAAAAIDVLAPKYLHGLLKRMPEIRYTIDLPLAHKQLGLSKRKQIGISLRGRYNQAIILSRSLKATLIPWFAQIAIRTGFRGEMRYGLINDMRKLDRDAMPHLGNRPRLADRWVHLGQPKQMRLPKEIPQPRLSVKPANAQICMEHLALNSNSPIMALAPGIADSPAKQWPARYFTETAEHYGKQGYQIWLLGAENDQAICRQITEATDMPINNLCGRTSLEDTIDILAQADIVLSNDSGLMHIAAAVGCSVIGIFGSTTPEYALPSSDWVKASWTGLSCSPCWQKTCRYGHYHCLTRITPKDIVPIVDFLVKQANL